MVGPPVLFIALLRFWADRSTFLQGTVERYWRLSLLNRYRRAENRLRVLLYYPTLQVQRERRIEPCSTGSGMYTSHNNRKKEISVLNQNVPSLLWANEKVKPTRHQKLISSYLQERQSETKQASSYRHSDPSSDPCSTVAIRHWFTLHRSRNHKVEYTIIDSIFRLLFFRRTERLWNEFKPFSIRNSRLELCTYCRMEQTLVRKHAKKGL